MGDQEPMEHEYTVYKEGQPMASVFTLGPDETLYVLHHNPGDKMGEFFRTHQQGFMPYDQMVETIRSHSNAKELVEAFAAQGRDPEGWTGVIPKEIPGYFDQIGEVSEEQEV